MNTIHWGHSTEGKAAGRCRLNFIFFSYIRKLEQYWIIFCRLPSRLARRLNYRGGDSFAVTL
jgi:hypothetical protein